jgi:hypothetical protein
MAAFPPIELERRKFWDLHLGRSQRIGQVSLSLGERGRHPARLLGVLCILLDNQKTISFVSRDWAKWRRPKGHPSPEKEEEGNGKEKINDESRPQL